jgi:hypothetical protein
MDYLVCYTMNAPVSEVAQFLDSTFHGYLASEGSSSSVWLVRSELSAEAMRNQLGPLLGKRGDLFIAQIADLACWTLTHTNPIDEFRKRCE